MQKEHRDEKSAVCRIHGENIIEAAMEEVRSMWRRMMEGDARDSSPSEGQVVFCVASPDCSIVSAKNVRNDEVRNGRRCSTILRVQAHDSIVNVLPSRRILLGGSRRTAFSTRSDS